MERQYFISNDLDELEDAQQELLKSGLNDEQVHVLSDDEAGVDEHHMHGVNAFSKTDIIQSTIRGALIGVVFSAMSLLVPYMFGLIGDIGWTPFLFLAIIALGFSTWEGGLWGIQEFNTRFSRFESQIHDGKHLMIIDIDDNQRNAVNVMASHHPKLMPTHL
ncbi:MAG: hypothetical protein HRU20_07630 [Pseudomonadales bacterium]|nr:hypothetical protein [Pseudomonadales bacterium]